MTTGSHQWQGITLSGRYKVTAKLGEGGMGFVYRAQDQNIDSEVVIKVPRQAMMDDPEFVARFTREIRSLVKLSHPHIVKVTDVGNFENVPFAVMQFLPGGSLEDQRSLGPDNQPLPVDPRGISRWLIAVADALDYIHGEGYVHRDVKPGNILFDSLGHAFLSDFGVAKVIASSTNAAPSQTAMTGAGMVLGTPEYMAPELIMGETFDGRVDQYALAITAYEMICGRRPFENETKTKVLVLHTSKAPPALSQWWPGLPDQLSQVVLKGLSKNPADRYPRCADFAKAIALVADTVSPQALRVRLKCAACGKTSSLSPADFARLKASGKRAPCPACKSPIDASAAEAAASAPGDGGTVQFSIPAATPDHAYKAAGGTMAPSGEAAQRINASQVPPRRQVSGTLIEQALPRQGSGTLVERALPRQGSGTLVERALPRADQPDPIDIFKNVSTSAPPLQASAAVTKKPGPDKTRVLMAGGAAAAAALLTSVATAFFLSGPKKASESPPAATTAKTQQPGPAQPGTSQAVLKSLHELPPSTKPGPPPTTPENSAASDSTRLAAQPNQTAPDDTSDSTKLAAAEDTVPEPPPTPKATPKKKKANVTAKRAQPVPSGFFATNKFDPARVPKRLTQLEYTRGKNIERAKARRGETLVAGGMYALIRANSDHPSGIRKYVATEHTLEEHGSQRVLQLTAHGSTELEVEPRLAKELDALDRKFIRSSLAILTLSVDSAGECGLVGAEFLEKCTPRLKRGYGIGQPDVEYQALTVSTEGSKSDKSPDEDWQRVGRMGPFFTHWKHRVEALNKMRQTMSMNQLHNFMGSIYSDAMKSLAAAGAAERANQRAISGQ